ncbi:hypothetical protein GGI09_005931 [Coemansia sp. S100]|nr:hypothetical protein GGI09_005931 [Coemansia sp. S100]
MQLKTSFVAVVDNELSKLQVVLGGVVQGSSLSPLLSNYMINKAPGLVRKEGLSACAARRRIGFIAFANDIAIVARSPDEAQSILDMMSTCCRTEDYMGPELCVFLATPQISLQIDGQALPQECYYKYLGVMIGVKGIAPKKNIELLCARARAKLGYMRSVGITHLGGNLNRVIGMYKAFIRPTMEYALEICIPNALLIKALECCQGRYVACHAQSTQVNVIRGYYSAV